MEKFILTLKDAGKRAFLLELLKQLDFVEVEIETGRGEAPGEEYDFFASAGLFADRDNNAQQDIQDKVDELARKVNKDWWERNKDRFLKQ